MRELNEEQRIAVSHFAGPMLVLAGPGSGKTYTITERIKRLVNEHDVAPSNILVITFTKAAAAGRQRRCSIWNISCGFLYDIKICLSL